MKSIFIDTNYLLRLLVRDNEEQYQIVYEIFQKAVQEKIKIITNIVVLFEITWVLTSFYKEDKIKLLENLNNILNFEILEIESKDLFQKALQLFSQTNISLEDCYHIVYAKVSNIGQFGSFDKKALKLFNQTSVNLN